MTRTSCEISARMRLRKRQGGEGILKGLELSISACRQAKMQFEICMSREDGFEDEEASILIHSIGTALKAVVEVAS